MYIIKSGFSILLWVTAVLLQGQHRQSRPLPSFVDRPVSTIEGNLTGWCYSLDGQWLTNDMKIPARLVSTDKKGYTQDENQLGNDNIRELQLFTGSYGEDSLILLVKFYTTGTYKYDNLKRGWNEKLVAYYYVFENSELNRLKNSINGDIQNIYIDLLAYGGLKNPDRFRVIDQIRDELVVDCTRGRKLLFTIQKKYPENKIRFQFASVFPRTKDVEGILHDFTVKGLSLYNDELLLTYMYYECKAKVLEYFLEPKWEGVYPDFSN